MKTIISFGNYNKTKINCFFKGGYIICLVSANIDSITFYCHNVQLIIYCELLLRKYVFSILWIYFPGSPLNGIFWFTVFNAFFLICDITGHPAWLLKYKVQDAKNQPVSQLKIVNTNNALMLQIQCCCVSIYNNL